jgi:hypothetical protein
MNMDKKSLTFTRSIIFGLLIMSLLTVPVPVKADGGPVVSDAEVWKMLDEGQQIAVIRLQSDQTAKVDLFISLLDRSQQSHSIVFFLPLGREANDFNVVEEKSVEFDQANTNKLDQLLTAEAIRKSAYRLNSIASILPGTLFINGAWSWPFLIPLVLSSCGAYAPSPQATFETANSVVSIYSVDSQIDLQALIKTTGLDPSVQETLRKLQGQQIAVISLQTQPPPATTDYSTRAQGQPGIHLTWTTSLIPQSSQLIYTYPLGTGRAWANPIELTRVYVVASPGMDFTVNYPEYGENQSGMAGNLYHYIARISSTNKPAYAIDDAVGDFGHVWRVTYIKSNATEDIVITQMPRLTRESRAALKRTSIEQVLQPITWITNMLAALAGWIIAWRFVMNRQLASNYQWKDKRLWYDALGWTLLYPVILAIIAAFTLWMLSHSRDQMRSFVDILIIPLAIIFLSGFPNMLLFARSKRKLGISLGRALGAYFLTVLLADVIYLSFSSLWVRLVLWV